MTLIISKDGKTIRLEKQRFENEAALQKYIYDCPEAIPLNEVSPGVTLLVLGREFPTKSGPIDVLGTDQTGHPYLIETKLYKNPDKRQVLAQVLDYGAALWSNPPTAELLLEAVNRDAAKRNNNDPVERLATFLETDEVSTVEHLARIAQALSEGRFTAIVLMDRLDERLRDLIRFLNRSSTFQLLAVELDYYRHDGSEIVRPRIFGAEIRRPPGGAAPKSCSDPDAWFANWKAKYGEGPAEAWRTFLDSALTSGIPALKLGHLPSCIPYLYLEDSPVGSVRLFRLAYKAPELRDELFVHAKLFEANMEAKAIRDRFRSAIENTVPGAYRSGSHRVYAPIEAVCQVRDSVIRLIAEFTKALKSIK